MALANVGGVAIRNNVRIVLLGLIPKALLPPMGLLIVYFIPGQPQGTRYVPPGAFAAQLGRKS